MKKFISKLYPLRFTLYPSKTRAGFTLPEIVVVVAIMLTLFALGTLSLANFRKTTSISSTLDAFIADVKEQQVKAMVGDTEGSGSAANYGVHFESTSYTLFRGTYGTANLVITLPSTLQVTTTFSGSQILFSEGSGEVGSAATVTFKDTLTNNQKVVSINRYGVVTAVN
jgi:prepilin-type N-terminal cleavage/methylation domain-containing protein